MISRGVGAIRIADIDEQRMNITVRNAPTCKMIPEDAVVRILTVSQRNCGGSGSRAENRISFVGILNGEIFYE